ncbi:MAG: murein biosynthesis integral membrane protein MurJ [Candidatus Nomurabacteria bacterium]|jgi:putative peptidoglycan lipid II flippase|nr:murein biosynthesis integral membrane protein MurJ [Candidatus Nomurabacteria bacterium]
MKRPKFRFKSVVALANVKLSIKLAAVLLASSTLISALLGIFRDRWLNSMYYNTYPAGLDAYTAAFTVPDFMFFILVSGALSVTFIPVFNQRLMTGNKKSAWELSSSILNILAALTLVASVLIMIFADPLIRYVVAPGLNESAMALAINMMRVIAINPFLFAISTVISSIQQAIGRFVFYAIAPALYNVGIIIGILVFTNGINIFGVQIFEGGIMGVALGVVLGAVLQLIVSLVGLFGLGFDYEFRVYWKNLGLKAVLKLLPARSLDQGIDYVSSIVNTNLASRMGDQSIRAYQQASSLHSMPVNLIGVAISTAFFPKLSEEVGQGNEDEFRQTFRSALRMIIWIAMPVAVIAFFARGYVVNFIKNGGDALIASVLGAFVVAIFCQSVFHIASRGFYARQNTKTPLIVSIIAIGLNIGLAILFSNLGFGPEGLAYATSVGSVVEIIILLAIQHIWMKGKLLNRTFWVGFAKMVLASVITGAIAYSMTKFFPLLASDDSFFSTFPKFCLISMTSIVAYVVAGYFLGIEEVRPIIEKIKKILFRNVS